MPPPRLYLMRSATLSTLLLLPFFTSCGSETQAEVDPLKAPLGLENAQLDLADSNELTAAKAALGKKLFFDPRLSKSGKMGCVECHHTDKAFTDGIAHSTKDSGGKNSRNSPTMYNVGYYPELYWDGRKVGLESNVLAAWTGQLGGVPADVATTLNGIEEYKTEFQAAFKADASKTTIVNALTSFLRTLRSGNSLYDQKKLSDDAKAGQELFTTKGGCAACHLPPLFTDKIYHNTGIGMSAESPDLGRAKKTKDALDNGKFKTPSLRDVSKTAPYFHDGSVETLREAVKIMASGGHKGANDGLLVDRMLTDKEVDQLVAFLKSLDNGVKFVEPVLPK
ncbi:MAG: cytochrome c peroxidase [Planctomycetota bacterium]